jgi:hypothetical protein
LARSIAYSVSARPSPVPRNSSRTYRSSSHASSLPVQMLWRKRSWTMPPAGAPASGAPSRYSVAGSAISRSTDARRLASSGSL